MCVIGLVHNLWFLIATRDFWCAGMACGVSQYCLAFSTVGILISLERPVGMASWHLVEAGSPLVMVALLVQLYADMRWARLGHFGSVSILFHHGICVLGRHVK